MNWAQQIVKADTEDTRLTDALLTAVRQRLPVIDRTLRDYGHMPLWAYLERLLASAPAGYQPREDLGEVVYRYAAPLLGEAAARQVRAELGRSPVVLTANHHGVDFFAQSVQSTLLFSLRASGGAAPVAVPVLACGNVPLNNVTYPRGALLYGAGSGRLDDMPQRLPLFPDRCKRQMVAQTPGLDQAMVQRAERQAVQMALDGTIAPPVVQALRHVLAEDYRAPEVASRGQYSEQAAILNGRIWRRLFAEPTQAPELVYLELERTASMLLETDLGDRRSLAFAVTFEPALRGRLLQALDGVRGCWQRGELLRRWAYHGPAQRCTGSLGCGTFLFWGIDEAGRRVPLLPYGSGGKADCLRGTDDRGMPWQVPLEPREIAQGLRDGRLLPSLFTCFLVIALARGVACIGGYYQADYLPAMRRGVVAALHMHADYRHVAQYVAKVPTGGYLSGMQAVMCRAADGGLAPAGPVEIIAGGGLAADDIDRVRALSVAEAHIASLFETVPDAAPEATPALGWKARLAAECAVLLRDKVVVK